jgi:hypothetical protein
MGKGRIMGNFYPYRVINVKKTNLITMTRIGRNNLKIISYPVILRLVIRSPEPSPLLIDPVRVRDAEA